MMQPVKIYVRLAQNPYLNVMVQSGYYDGACDYFNAKYNLWQMDPSGKLKDRMSWKGYRSGHMMYLRKQDLETANDDIRAFIKVAAQNWGTSKVLTSPIALTIFSKIYTADPFQ
jgi:carboxypeptidase C (cathepsin A)